MVKVIICISISCGILFLIFSILHSHFVVILFLTMGKQLVLILDNILFLSYMMRFLYIIVSQRMVTSRQFGIWRKTSISSFKVLHLKKTEMLFYIDSYQQMLCSFLLQKKKDLQSSNLFTLNTKILVFKNLLIFKKAISSSQHLFSNRSTIFPMVKQTQISKAWWCWKDPRRAEELWVWHTCSLIFLRLEIYIWKSQGCLILEAS